MAVITDSYYEVESHHVLCFQGDVLSHQGPEWQCTLLKMIPSFPPLLRSSPLSV